MVACYSEYSYSLRQHSDPETETRYPATQSPIVARTIGFATNDQGAQSKVGTVQHNGDGSVGVGGCRMNA